MRKRQFCTLLLVFFSVCSFLTAEAAEEETAALEAWQTKSEQAIAGLSGFTADVTLEESVTGSIKGIERIHMIYQKNPTRLYFHWLDNSDLYKGLQASWVPSRDGENQFQGVAGGFKSIAGVQTFEFKSGIIRKLYPHQFRMRDYNPDFIIRHTRQTYDAAKAKGALSVKKLGTQTKNGQPLEMFAIKLADAPGYGFPYKSAVIGFNKQTGLPGFVELTDFSGKVWGRYNLYNMKLNPQVPADQYELKK